MLIVMESIFFCAYFVFFFAWGIIRYQYQKQYKRTHEVKLVERAPRREQMLVKLVGSFVAVSTLLWAFSVIDFAQVPMPALLRWLGVPVGLASTWLFYLVHRQLDKNWSPVLEIRASHELIVTGVYRLVRHPMYTAMFIWLLGNVFLTANWLLVFIQGLAIFILFMVRIPDEEKLMADQFGQQYLAYTARTKRLIPFLF
jgi:protein-S-isoprenylcysteine O-methyltransferase Ste14